MKKNSDQLNDEILPSFYGGIDPQNIVLKSEAGEESIISKLAAISDTFWRQIKTSDVTNIRDKVFNKESLNSVELNKFNTIFKDQFTIDEKKEMNKVYSNFRSSSVGIVLISLTTSIVLGLCSKTWVKRGLVFKYLSSGTIFIGLSQFSLYFAFQELDEFNKKLHLKYRYAVDYDEAAKFHGLPRWRRNNSKNQDDATERVNEAAAIFTQVKNESKL